MTGKRSERADEDWRIAYMPVGGDGPGVEQVCLIYSRSDYFHPLLKMRDTKMRVKHHLFSAASPDVFTSMMTFIW